MYDYNAPNLMMYGVVSGAPLTGRDGLTVDFAYCCRLGHIGC